MSNTVSIQHAAANLPQLVESLGAEDEIILTDGNRAVAKIVLTRRSTLRRQPGSARGMLTVLSEDDAHLADFEEYMP
jgi:antitoxin (DNA-binding transcriptional repressor) of toxin-antitoxin stability system